MQEYIVVEKSQKRNLEYEVNELLKQGYKLVGGVGCMVVDNFNSHYLQSMVKETKEVISLDK